MTGQTDGTTTMGNIHTAHIRLECLKFAMQVAEQADPPPSDEEIRRVAENMFEFVTGDGNAH